jgi:alpha-1,3-glucosyltransferase
VATFWCNLNIVLKLNKFQQNHLILGSLALTLITSLIPVICILIHYRASRKITNLSFFIISLCFFLFSFHVHEKTILVPFLAYILNIKRLPDILQSFSNIAIFSLYPLLKREEQEIPYLLLLIINNIVCQYIAINKPKIHKYLDNLNIILIILYHVLELTVPPPTKLPWLYPMLNALISFINFSIVLLYSYYILYKNTKVEKRNIN